MRGCVLATLSGPFAWIASRVASSEQRGIHLRWLVAATVVWLGVGLTRTVAASPSDTHCDCRVGQTFQISRDVETAEKGTDGSSGSSTDRDSLEERVVGSGQAGTELEYDLPRTTSMEDRARQWQFPARVLIEPSGGLRLLNQSQLAARSSAWRKAGGLTEVACGHWIFTWNAFQVECDPQSVIKTIDGFDVGPSNLAAGSLYRDRQALGSALLKPVGVPGSTRLYAEMAINPDAVRRDEAEADVVTAEIMRKPTTIEAALRTHSAEQITGKVTVCFDIDAGGHAQRQIKTTVVNIRRSDGVLKTRTVTLTLERKLVGD